MSEFVAFNKDCRYVIPEPVFQSPLEEYLYKYCAPNEKSNPLNVYLDIKDKVIDSKFVPVLSLQQKIRSGSNIIKEKSTAYIDKFINGILYEPQLNGFTKQEEAPIFDYQTGTLRFILRIPSDQYKKEKIVFQGIELHNPYPASKVWTDTYSIKSKVSVNLTTNSSEDLIFKNKDKSIQQIREMGVFDQNGELVLYCWHPVVEYRNDTQHISYTIIIAEK